MIFFIRHRILAWLAPDHRLRCKRSLWIGILDELARRGRGARESGAFLLGRSMDDRNEIVDAVYYDDLAPDALSTGAINFPGSAYGVLWQLCKERGLHVVADIHTHPGVAIQSTTDRDHPMIAQRGHIAIIVPKFAQPPRDDGKLGVYEYNGGHRWLRRDGRTADDFSFGLRYE